MMSLGFTSTKIIILFMFSPPFSFLILVLVSFYLSSESAQKLTSRWRLQNSSVFMYLLNHETSLLDFFREKYCSICIQNVKVNMTKYLLSTTILFVLTLYFSFENCQVTLLFYQENKNLVGLNVYN